MAIYYPPVGFHFSVEFKNLANKITDHRFQSVSGISVELEHEELAEGGENRFKHRIPVRTKYPNLVLKRGLLIGSAVINWCKKAIENFEIQPVDITVSLLDENSIVLQSWDIIHAYPVKWSVAELNAEKSEVVIETIELSYNYFTINR